MNHHSILSGPTPHRTLFALVMLIALTWSSPAFCDNNHEIDDAAARGDLETVQALLKGNSDLASSKDGKGHTPLYWAAANGHVDVAELLLANRAEVDAKDNNGATALYDAASQGHKDVAELLLAKGADVNAKANVQITLDGLGKNDVRVLHGTWTPLRAAVSHHHKEVAHLLRQHGGHD